MFGCCFLVRGGVRLYVGPEYSPLIGARVLLHELGRKHRRFSVSLGERVTGDMVLRIVID